MSIGWETLAIWAAIKKYSLKMHHLPPKHFMLAVSCSNGPNNLIHYIFFSRHFLWHSYCFVLLYLLFPVSLLSSVFTAQFTTYTPILGLYCVQSNWPLSVLNFYSVSSYLCCSVFIPPLHHWNPFFLLSFWFLYHENQARSSATPKSYKCLLGTTKPPLNLHL